MGQPDVQFLITSTSQLIIITNLSMDKEVPENANQNCPGVQSEKAGKQEACQGCPNQSACSSGTLTINPAIKTIADKLSAVKHKILVLSGKGGVGKSTVATQLAVLLSQKYEVGLLDVDICGPSVPTMLGMVGQQVHQSAQGWSPVYNGQLAVMSIGFLLSNQNDAVIWRGPRKNGLIQQFLQEVNWGELDFLIIDTPPGTSDQHLSLVQFLQCGQGDGAIVVTTPQEVALADVRKQLSFCIKTKIPIIGVVENMSGFVCPNCKCQAELFNASSGGATKMCEEFKCPLITKIPLDPMIQAMIDKGQSIFELSQTAPISPVIGKYHEIEEFLCNKFKLTENVKYFIMNEVWNKSLKLHFQRLYPGQTTIIIEQLSEAFKLIHGNQKNQFIGYAIKSKTEDKNNPEDIVSFEELKSRIESTYSDTKDSMYIDTYFNLIDDDGDGFITYQDLEAHSHQLSFPSMSEKAFLSLTERFHHDSTKLGKPEFTQIIRQYI